MKSLRLNQNLFKFALVASVLIGLTLTGFNGECATPKKGGTLRIGAQADAVVIGYPPLIRRVNSSRVLNTCLETLVRFDEKGTPIPWLATGWKVGDDAKSITFELRQGIKFHDGTVFNAATVKWNLMQYKASKRPEFKQIESIDILNDYALRLNLANFDNTIIGNLAGAAGTIISPAAFEKKGQKWCETHPVGTGPFKFVEWERDVRQVYERFDDYWQNGKPYLDKVEWLFIADPMTLLAAFKNGDVDVIVEVSPKDAKEMQASDKYEVSRAKVGVGGFGITFDSANPESPFANLKVRQATTHAIDTKTIVENITHNFFEHTNQLVSSAHWAYNPAVKGYPYNPDRAKQLLSEAGYPDGFKTKLISWNKPPHTVDAFTAVQGYLKEVGIDAELELIDTGRLHKIVVGGGWEGLMWAAPGAPNPDATRAFSTDLSSRGPLWKQLDHPKDYEDKLTEALQAPDFESKKRLTWELQSLSIDKHCMIIFLWSRADLGARHVHVKDDGLYSLNRTQWNPADAWINK